MGKSSFSAKEKYKITQYNVTDETIKERLYQFQTYEMDGLNNPSGWKRYSTEIKTAAVFDYHSGNYIHSEIVRKYEISSVSVLRGWIKIYNDHRELKDTQRMSNSMIKARSTTLAERLKTYLDKTSMIISIKVIIIVMILKLWFNQNNTFIV